MRLFVSIFVTLLVMVAPAVAQVSIPFTFTSGTVASSSQVNSNFTQLGNQSLNRAGGTITGNIAVDSGITIDGIDLSVALATGGVGATLLASTTVVADSYGSTVEIPSFTVDEDGRLTAASNIATSTLLGISESGITDGAILARVAANETISGTWTFSGATTFTSTTLVSNTLPILALQETDGGSNAKIWAFVGDAGIWALTAYNDNFVGGNNALTFTRSGSTVTAATIGAPTTISGGVSATTGTFSSVVTGPVGSASAPAFTFAEDTNTGVFRTGTTDQLGLAAGGVGVVDVTSLRLALTTGAWGTGSTPAKYLYLGRNTSGSGAAGCALFALRDGSFDIALYATTSGMFRWAAVCPGENDSHNGGVVGDQTSSLGAKDILGTPEDSALLDAVLNSPVRIFQYKDGRYNNETFTGIITDWSPHFGKDGNRALNEINAIGYLVGSIRALEKRVAELEASQ